MVCNLALLLANAYIYDNQKWIKFRFNLIRFKKVYCHKRKYILQQPLQMSMHSCCISIWMVKQSNGLHIYRKEHMLLCKTHTCFPTFESIEIKFYRNGIFGSWCLMPAFKRQMQKILWGLRPFVIVEDRSDDINPHYLRHLFECCLIFFCYLYKTCL